MKKMIVLLLAVLVLFTFSCKKSGDADNTLAKIKKQGYFVLGLDDSFPPMGFRDNSGEIVGFDIDLAAEAAKRLGVEVKLKPVDWDGVILSLKKGDIDLVWNGMTITESRKKQIAFSDTYLENKQIVIVGIDGAIQSKADLKDKTVGLQMGSSSEEALKNDASVTAGLKEIKKYSNNIEALLDLKAGRIDAVVVDEIVGRYYIAKKPGIYRVLNDDFGRESYGIGFRQEDVAFLTAINNALDEMRNDGSAAAISKKWFDEDIMAN